MSWNVNMSPSFSNGDLLSRGDLIVNTIQLIDPAILLLQEASASLLFEIKRVTEYRVVFSSLSSRGMTATLVRESIISAFTPQEKTSNYHRITLNMSKCSIEIYNVHFDSRSTLEYRKMMMENMIRESKGIQLMIVGDFNTDADLNTFEVKDLGDKDVITWENSFFVNGSLIKKRLDRVLTNLKVSDFTVHSEFSGQSDHLPLSFDFYL